MFKAMDIAKIGLKEETVKKIQECITQFPEIKKVVLYGSRAKGNYRAGSDIDLCLIGEGLNSQILLKLDNTLDDLMLPYTFDLSIYDKIDNPNFKDHIDRVGLIFFEVEDQNA